MRRAVRAGLLAPILMSGAACGYLGESREFHPKTLESEPDGWVAVRGVRFVPQEEEADCGAAALAMVLDYWTRPVTPKEVMAAYANPANGLRARDLRDFVRSRGLAAYLIDGEMTDLANEVSKGRPVIVGLVKPYITGDLAHYEVVVAVNLSTGRVVTLDPARGWRVNTTAGFYSEWEPARRLTLVVFEKPVKGESP